MKNELNLDRVDQAKKKLDALKNQIRECEELLCNDMYSEYYCAVRGDDQEMMLFKNLNLRGIFDQMKGLIPIAQDMLTIIRKDYVNVNKRLSKED